MLQVVIQKGKRLFLLTQLRNDDSVTEAVAIAIGAMTNNKGYKRAFVYLKNGSKPVKIKTISVSWTGKVKAR